MGELIYRDGSIEITEELVRVGATSYAVPTINSVSSGKAPIGVGRILLAGLGALIVLFSFAFFQTGSPGGGLVVLAIGAAMIWPAVSRFLSHTLELSTSSGAMTALMSRDADYIAKIRQEILKGMSAARAVKPAADYQPPRPKPIESAPAADATAAGDTMTCPECAETIKAAAKVCRYCGHRLMQSIN